MNAKAKSYIACAATAGLTLLAVGLFQAGFPNPTRLSIFLLLALLASTLKVHLPGITGTMSVSFLFILMGIADYTFSETILVGCAGALLQSVWKAKRRPKPVQILFNISTLAISISVSYWGSHFVLGAARTSSLVVLLALAACLFFLTNTGLVATVLSLVEEKPLKNVWRQCYAWSFPYYLVGAAIATVISLVSRSVGWKVSLLVLPVMYLTYVWYRQYLETAAHEQTQLTPAGHPDELGVSYSEKTERAGRVAD